MENLEINNLNIKADKIIFISDIHFGKHRNTEEWQENMKNYFYNFFIPLIKKIKKELAKNEKLVCINLGDTYDDRTSIDINISNLSIDIFEDIAKEVEVYILNGNHDLSKKTNKGNTSLRSIDLIPNIKVITDPTYIKIESNKNVEQYFIAIPYLGDSILESKYLAEYSTNAQYALMHTELNKMKMDNGMLITNGANAELFNGTIFAGHIHKRQENNKCIYVGSPYHLSKADIGNDKGIYILNINDNKIDFIKNNYSPIYQSIYMEDYISMNIDERKEFFDNNYTYILLNEEDILNYKKKYDIYNLGIGTTAKMAKLIIRKKIQNITIEEGKDYKELSLNELINDSIKQLDTDDDTKNRLYKLSDNYIKDAESEISHD